jgi:hypothetical protein
MRQKISIIALFISVICSTCEFEPTGTNYQQVDQSVPEAVIDLNTASDTIRASGIIHFIYSVDLQGRKLHQLDFLLDDEVFHTEFDTSGSFEFNSALYDSGQHKMRLQVRAASGTGSLGDQYGREEVYNFREWTMFIDNEPPNPVAILHIVPSLGRLRIEWGKYNRWNFQQYEVYTCRSEDYSEQLYRIGTILNQDSTSFVDSSYIGGESTYWIDVAAYGGRSRSEPEIFSAPIPGFLYFHCDTENNIVLSWSRCQFENNLNEYQLSRYLLNYTTTVAAETVCVDSTAGFGTSIPYELFIRSDQPANHPRSIFADTLSAYIGVRFFEFQWMSFVAALNSYFLQGWDYIRRIDPGTFAVNAIIPRYSADGWTFYEFNVSTDGQHAYTFAINVNENTRVLKTNPVTLEFAESYLLNDILPFPFKAEVGSTIQISNQNTLAFQCYHSTGYPYTQNDGIVLIDMNSQEYLNLLRGVIEFKLAPNGNYLISEDSLYAISGGQFNPIGAIDGLRSAFLGDGDQIVCTSDYMIRILNSADLGVVASHTIDHDLMQPCEDPLNNTIGAKYYISDFNQFYRVYDLNTGEQLNSVRTLPVGPVYIYDHTLFNAWGYYLKLE